MSQALLSPAPASESASTAAHAVTVHETSVVVHENTHNATHVQSDTRSADGDVVPIDAVSASSESSWFDFTFGQMSGIPRSSRSSVAVSMER